VRKLTSGGGWQAIRYALRKGREVGYLRLWRAMTSKNACKTCALGMGGQLGGMRNEAGRSPEVCKKSLQAMAADMRGRIEPRFFETYSLAQLKGFSPRELEMAGRLTEPIYAGPNDTHYRTIAWGEAYERIAAKLKQTEPERSFFYSSGRSSNEAGFLMQLLARVYGTNHVNNCSYYCHQASGVGLKDSVGTGTSTVTLDDLESCDLLFLIGGNPASNHPRLMTSLMKMRARGGHVIVVNPVRELGLERFKVPSNLGSMLRGSEIASLYLQPVIGGDIALLAGLSKVVLDSGREDSDFIANHTTGFEGIREMVRDLDWTLIEEHSGVPREQIEIAAQMYLGSARTIFGWTMGITHHEHGVENVQWIANLALLRGMIGKPGAGLMPIRGHSNVQGLGTIGVTPALSQAALEGLAKLGVPVPRFAGYDTMSAMEAAGRGEIDFAFCLGGNLFGANPESSFAGEALGKVETLVYLNTTLNTGHAHGRGQETFILPVKARDEESEATTQESMFNYVRLSDGGRARHAGLASEVEIISQLGERVAPEAPFDWPNLKHHDAIRGLIARLVPELKPIEDIGRSRKEFHVQGRVLHEPVFNTPDGRASFRPHGLPTHPRLEPRQLRLMTVRSEGQFNTVVYEEEDLYRGQDRRDVILVNPLDLQALGFTPDQPVDVLSTTGRICGVLIRPIDIARGCALMYYPEANVLIPRRVDPRSRTPSFKSALIEVRPSEQAAMPDPGIIRLDSVRGSRSGMRSC